jgi:hypothetical protein
MTFDMHTWGDYSSADGFDHGPAGDAIDHWLDDRLRAVPLPDGFFARLRRLADPAPDVADDRGDNGRRGQAHHSSTRGLSDVSRRYATAKGRIRP